MPHIMRLTTELFAAAFLLVITATLSHASNDRWLSPISGGDMVRAFEMTNKYGPGHRGVDFAATPGSPVRAVADGTVSWVGVVAGRTTMSIDHGTEKSTYEPIAPTVSRGDRVSRGDIVGTLVAGHSDCRPACLHLGRIQAGNYLDPAERFGNDNGYRLISPEGAPPKPPALVTLSGVLPVAGIQTSQFGLRIDPFTGKRSFHDGLDLAAPCGKPVAAVGAGTVTLAQSKGAYGLLVEVSHPGNTRTGYAHLSRINVSVGARVQRGTVLGEVGTTGRSTGCHLHFMKRENGIAVNPLNR